MKMISRVLPSFWTKRTQFVLLAATSLFLLLTFHQLYATTSSTSAPHTPQPLPKKTRVKELVVASLKSEDTSWIAELIPDWNRNIYVVDDPHAPLTVPRNKGREAMVYLTFIIDNYHDLPEYMVFMHSQRYQWHNDDPLYDGLPMVKLLQLPYLASKGYINLRCVWVLGCPSEVKPRIRTGSGSPPPEGDSRAKTEYAYGAVFTELFPGQPVPEIVATSCCAQFALTKEKVLERPLADYVRYREWLLNTPYEDDVSGRILEYTWHIIFGKPAIHCPDPEECYRNVWGLQNLTCKHDSCDGRYTLPKYSTLPKGWPEVGWST